MVQGTSIRLAYSISILEDENKIRMIEESVDEIGL